MITDQQQTPPRHQSRSAGRRGNAFRPPASVLPRLSAVVERSESDYEQRLGQCLRRAVDSVGGTETLRGDVFLGRLAWSRAATASVVEPVGITPERAAEIRTAYLSSVLGSIDAWRLTSD